MEMLEKRIRQLEIELVKHVGSAHYFSGHQAEEVSGLEERLGLLGGAKEETQDPLIEGALHTIKGVIIEKEGGNPEPYLELAQTLNDFSKRQLRKN